VGNLGTTLGYSFLFLATTAGRLIGRFDFAIDCSYPRSNATSKRALIQMRSDSRLSLPNDHSAALYTAPIRRPTVIWRREEK